MLFFMCNLAKHVVTTNPPAFILHSMSAKILRRYRKLGSSVPKWLCDMVSHTCTGLSHTLDQRWQKVRTIKHLSSTWDPTRFNLTKDVYPSFPPIHENISTSVANLNRRSDPTHIPFFPNTPQRGTFIDVLSDPCRLLSPPKKDDDIHVTLYDVECAIAEDIDDWVACVTNVDEACEQLEHLVHQYSLIALDTYHHKEGMSDPDHLSIAFLTIIELWVALDKLVVKEIPILSEYSPEVPIALLSRLCFRDAVSNHRLCRVYQYLLARHSQAYPGWLVLSPTLTEQSFPCRYYDCFPHLQRLKALLQDTISANPLHAKAIVFELQCPMSFDTWRSVTYRISGAQEVKCKQHKDDVRVYDDPALQPYIRGRASLTALYSSPSRDRLYYFYTGSHLDPLKRVAFRLPEGPYADSGLQHYLDGTRHTSNQIFAAQANCHPDLSLHEFVAFAHLRSGGSLQWFNILRELRSRTLDFHHQEVYLLLARATAEVGPLDSTGELLWHKELQDASFCYTFLGEIKTLFIDLGEGSLDGPAMAVISLLVGVLATIHSSDISEQATQLLRKVRRKTFDWVHELLYNVRKSPSSQEGLELLRDMAAVCRSTFDVGSATGHKPIHAVEDIEAALSCAMLMCTTVLPASESSGTYNPRIG